MAISCAFPTTLDSPDHIKIAEDLGYERALHPDGNAPGRPIDVPVVLSAFGPKGTELAAVGAGWALQYHLAYEYGGNEAVMDMPGGAAWLAVVNETRADERHLATHTNHLMALNDADRAAWDAGGSALLDQVTVTGTADEIRSRVEELEASGVTEIAYQPMGPDVPRELERFIAAATR